MKNEENLEIRQFEQKNKYLCILTILERSQPAVRTLVEWDLDVLLSSWHTSDGVPWILVMRLAGLSSDSDLVSSTFRSMVSGKDLVIRLLQRWFGTSLEAPVSYNCIKRVRYGLLE